MCASLAPAALAAKAAPTTTQIAYQPESFAEFEKQLAAGQVQSVTINKRLRSLRITLKDGRYVLAKYKPKEETKVAAVLTGDHVPVVVLSPPPPSPKSPPNRPTTKSATSPAGS